LPSSLRRSVYITMSVALRPLFLLCPYVVRFFFLPLRSLRPRRWQPHAQSFLCFRFRRRTSQFCVGDHRHRLATHLDDQHFAVVVQNTLRGRERRSPLAQPDGQRLDRFGRRRPSKHGLRNVACSTVAHLDGKSRHHVDHLPAEAVLCGAQYRVQRNSPHVCC